MDSIISRIKIIASFILVLGCLTVSAQQVKETSGKGQPYGNNQKTGRYVKSGDAKIYYEVYGKGQPIVVLHGGIVGSIKEMGQFIDSLSQKYKVIAISTRGHGKSEMGHIVPSYDQKSEDVNAVIQQETKDKVTVLGFSDGAYTGFFFAKNYPDKINKLIAIGAGEWKRGSRQFNMSAQMLLSGDSEYWKQQFALRPEPKRIDEWFKSINAYYNSLEVGPSIFSEVKCPVLVLAGEKDENAPLNTVLATYHDLPNAQLSIVPDAPHPVFMVNFPAVWSAIVPFLNNEFKTVNKSNKMENNVEKILVHHLTAFGNNNLDAIMEDYMETSVIFTPNGIVKGLDNIRQFFKDFFEIVPTGSKFGMQQKHIEGNVAYIAWNSDSDKAEIPMGTDTFVFEGEKIQYHTVADYRIKK